VYGTICSLVWESRGSPELWYASTRKPRGKGHGYYDSPPGDSLIKNPPFSKTNHEILAEFRWCGEGAAGLVWRPGPRPAPLGRPGHIPAVPSRPKHPAQPLALDVGSPRAAQVTGKGYNSSHVTRSPHPTGPACSHDPCASKSCSGALASCAVRERQVARPVSRRRAARPTGLPIARNCGAR
jgi:hypothetical protein